MTDVLISNDVVAWIQLLVLVVGGGIWHLFQFWSGTHGWAGFFAVVGGVFGMFLFGSYLYGLAWWAFSVSPWLIVLWLLGSAAVITWVQPGEDFKGSHGRRDGLRQSHPRG